jgi:Zn-dependent peptidase ImmA (M78 family)
MSLRHNKYDNFWFTLLHELGHIIKEHKKDCYIYDNEDTIKNNAV